MPTIKLSRKRCIKLLLAEICASAPALRSLIASLALLITGLSCVCRAVMESCACCLALRFCGMLSLSTVFIFCCISFLATCASAIAWLRTESMLFSSACLRLLMFSVCGPRKSTTSSVSRDLSFSSAVCAPVLTPFVCSCNCAIRVCCASTQAANARLVFPPNTPSSVTPITACPSLTLLRS